MNVRTFGLVAGTLGTAAWINPHVLLTVPADRAEALAGTHGATIVEITAPGPRSGASGG